MSDSLSGSTGYEGDHNIWSIANENGTEKGRRRISMGILDCHWRSAMAIPFFMASLHVIQSVNVSAPSSGPSFSTGPSQGTHGSGGASPRSGWLQDLDREWVMGWERDIE